MTQLRLAARHGHWRGRRDPNSSGRKRRKAQRGTKTGRRGTVVAQTIAAEKKRTHRGQQKNKPKLTSAERANMAVNVLSLSWYRFFHLIFSLSFTPYALAFHILILSLLLFHVIITCFSLAHFLSPRFSLLLIRPTPFPSHLSSIYSHIFSPVIAIFSA
jgi:hypothetical protein